MDKKTDAYTQEGQTVEVVDLPGIYSLNASSVDDQVARAVSEGGERFRLSVVAWGTPLLLFFMKLLDNVAQLLGEC